MTLQDVISVLEQFYPVECPECHANISWPEYHDEKEIEQWLKSKEKEEIHD
jgi:hypothetical protein